MNKTIIMLLTFLIIASFACVGCSEEEIMQDGYYTAEMSDYEFGWKEYVTINVKNNKIASVEYNATNKSGFIKSWDNAYMKNMISINGTYPNEYTRNYAKQFLEKQSYDNIDTITGATSSHYNFERLSKAVVEQAKKGDSSIITVEGDPNVK